MGIRNRISPTQGFVSEDLGKDRSGDLRVEHLANDRESLVYVDDRGTALTGSIARLTRFEYHEHNGLTQEITGGLVWTQVQINDLGDSYDGGLTTWDPTTSVFRPDNVGDVYSFRVAGTIDPVGGNPVLNLDFILSGSDPNDPSLSFRHHQSYEMLIRATVPHVHVQANYTIFADEDLFVSGGILVATSTGTTLTLHSASIMVKEG
jgi:hypothetical protein